MDMTQLEEQKDKLQADMKKLKKERDELINKKDKEISKLKN